MLWIKLGWRNLLRNRRRTFIEVLSIAGSVLLAVFMNNLAVGSYDQMVNDGVLMGSGHIGVYNSAYLSMRKTELTVNAPPLVGALEREPSVKAVYPRLQVPALIRSSRDSRNAVVVGLDFDRELNSNPLLRKDKLVEGSYPSSDDAKEALMGEILARELGLKVGKKFVIMVQGSDGKIESSLFRISGIIRTNARMIDAGMVIAPRKVIGSVIGKPDSAHEIAVILYNHRHIEKVLPAIRAIARTQPEADAFRWQEAMPELQNAIKMDRVGFQIMVMFMYLIVGIGTINTLLMSVMERTREFGVIRSIGLNKKGIRKIVLSEALVLATVGVTLGMALGIAVTGYTSVKGIDYSFILKDQGMASTLIDPIIYSAWDWYSMSVIAGGMIIIAFAASIYPVHYILKTGPAEAMRKY